MASFASDAFFTDAFSDSAFDFDGVSPPVVVTTETYTGGFFHAFDIAQARRRKRLKELEEAEEAVKEIPDNTDREIAEFLREQERLDVERQERERLQALARQFLSDKAANEYGERVAKAMARMAIQANYSAAEAFLREVKRDQEDMDFLIKATILMIELS